MGIRGVVLIVAILVLIAGAAKGLSDRLQHHYHTIPAGWSRKFWDPSISWKNKYKNYPNDKRAKFPGSKTWLVFLTDGWHLMQFVCWNSLLIAIVLRPEPLNWWVGLLIFIGVFKVGFHVAYK